MSPQNYVPPPVPRKASGGVVALGVINIIYAVLFRFCCGLSLLMFSSMGPLIEKLKEKGAEMPPIEAMPEGVVRSYLIISGFVLLALGLFLLIGGIGLLMLRPWGRSLSMGVAAAEIVWVIIDLAISIFFIYPSTVQFTGGELSESAQLISQTIWGIILAFVRLVYPVILLVCLNLRSIKVQFEPTFDQQR